jgi:PAS domain S-box-containing protein
MTRASEPDTETLRVALHAAPSGIVVVDARGKIVFANQTLAQMFGHRLEDLLGKPVEILLPEQHAAAHRGFVEDFARRRQSRPMGAGRDLEGVSKDGRRFPVEIGLRAVPADTGGMVVATVIDITRRKAIEERLRKHEEQLEELVAERTRELREAQRERERVLEHLIQAEKMTAVGTLVSGIGHEINNPLYVVLAAAEALATEQDPARSRAHGEEILKQAKRIADIVKSLSRYAQPSARHDLQRVDINAPIAEAARLAGRALRDDRIAIKTTAGRIPDILAKPEDIQQAAFNIIRNAIQAIPGKGRVEIETGEEAGWVTARIEDSGEGIPSEHIKQIFDPFFTTKGPDEGEGLGLYIVRQIVTRYRGTIDVENVAGGGARFMIRFPAAGVENTEGSRS